MVVVRLGVSERDEGGGTHGKEAILFAVFTDFLLGDWGGLWGVWWVLGDL